MAKIGVNGAELFYQLSGSGPPVLQVPGAVSGHEGYAQITPSMAEHFTVIDYDPRGYGQSDRPSQKYTFDVWANDMVGLLDAIEVDRAHVHGGSMGSTLGVHFAARFPHRVRGLVLSGCTAKSDFLAKAQYEVWKALARAYGTGSAELAYELCSKAASRGFLDGPGGGPDLVAAVMDLAGRYVTPEVFCDACDALIDVDVTAELADVKAPTLVIVGNQDLLTPADQGPTGAGGRFIFDNLSNVPFKDYVELEDSGHANLMDSAEACLSAIIPFLERVDAELVD